MAKQARTRKTAAKNDDGDRGSAIDALQKAHESSPVFDASKEQLRGFYEQMLLIRRFEEKAGQLYGLGADRGLLPFVYRAGSGRDRIAERARQ